MMRRWINNITRLEFEKRMSAKRSGGEWVRNSGDGVRVNEVFVTWKKKGEGVFISHVKNTSNVISEKTWTDLAKRMGVY